MIEIQNVSMLFKKKGLMESGEPFRAVDGVSIAIPDGCIYGFLGSNGAGKSTLMRMMCGVYKTSEGSIKIDGQEVYDNPKAKGSIFFINDETVQYGNYTLDGLRKYYKGYYPTFSDEVFGRLVGRLSLPLDKRLSEFSKGMKRQAVVIIGLSCMTQYLMLDEAFDGLDPAMRKVVKNMIVDEMLDRQATLIVSSHNIAEINELCDRAMLIHKGRLVFSGELDEISGGFRKVQMARKNLPVTREELESTGVDVMQFSCTGSISQAVIKGTEEDIMRKLGTVKTDLTEMIPLTLEEIFIYELEARGYGSEYVPNDK